MSLGMRQYIEERSIPIPFAGCWLWLNSISSNGYGNAQWNGRFVTAHRLAFRAFKGVIPAGKLIQHGCDRRWCVNPDHLSIGTYATNNRDRQIKGNAAKKLAPHEIVEIRMALRAGVACRALARRFHVDPALIRDIRDRRAWNHIAEEGTDV